MSADSGSPPFVSVVIPTFNRGWCIERAVQSVLSQTDPRFEVLVADDGSTDDTRARVHALAARDPRVRYEPLPRNAGVIAARDHGIQRARGEWVLLLDSDDELLPHALAEFARAIARIADRQPPVRILFADFLDTGTGTKKSRDGAFRENPLGYEAILAQSFFGDLLPLVRRDLFAEVPYRMQQKRVMQIIWYRLFRRSDVFYVGETLALCHTQGADRITRNRAADARLWVEGMRQLLREFGEDMARVSRRQLAARHRILAMLEVAAGHRRDALQSAARALSTDAHEWKALPVALATLLPQPLAARLLLR